MKKLISFFEIPAKDFERAVAFYRNVLEVKIKAHDWGTEKMAFLPDDGENVTGAISVAPDFEPSSQGVLISFNGGGDLSGMLERVEKSGGKVLIPKTKIEAEDKGYFAVFLDCEGNRLGVYSDN